MRRALLAATLLLGCLVPPVAAHEELALHSLTVLGSVSPALEGVELRVVHLGAPAFAVHNQTDERLTVLDDDGRPFLEIGPRGVRADVSSALFYEGIVPGRHDHIEPKPGRGPRWVTFSSEPRWTWFDPRLEKTGSAGAWRIPFRHADRPVTVSGGFEPLEHHGHFLSELDTPTLEGLDVRLVQGPVPAVYVRNDGSEVLEVLGSANEPFLRIGPRGVSANVMSPSYYSAGRLTIERVPIWADATARPRWKRISSQPVWAWLEYRAAVSPDMQRRDLLGATQRAIHEWTSPMTLGGEPLELEGRVLWIPPKDGHPTPSSDTDAAGLLRTALLGAAGLILLASLVALVRRPRSQPV